MCGRDRAGRARGGSGGPDTYVAYGEAWAAVSNTPFREYKHWTHEGGISTPQVVHWPTGIPKEMEGKLVHAPGHLVDIMATCLDVAGTSYPAKAGGQELKPLEGISLRPALAGGPLKRLRRLCWEHEGNRAVREGDWKLVAKARKPWELDDIAKDRSERRDLAAEQPERVKAMAAQWDEYAARCDVLPLGAWKGKGGK